MKRSPSESARRQRIVAEGRIAGHSRTEIAKAAGVRPDQVHIIAKHPATRMLIEELLEPERDRIRKLAHKAVSAVERALEAKNTRGRPMYEIQLRGVGRFATLAHLAAGDRPPEPQTPGAMTWQQFVIFCQSIEKTADGHAIPE